MGGHTQQSSDSRDRTMLSGAATAAHSGHTQQSDSRDRTMLSSATISVAHSGRKNEQSDGRGRTKTRKISRFVFKISVPYGRDAGCYGMQGSQYRHASVDGTFQKNCADSSMPAPPRRTPTGKLIGRRRSVGPCGLEKSDT